MSAAERKAVFLSYASQDAEAARRICDALRAAGVEVWFDQSELRGGDAWDAKIRKQIKECALFVPVISANTQARGEGYFRLEWKLAVDRSHLMARDQAFLVPVAADSTAGMTARVPDEFHAVQWTRLDDLSATQRFADRVRALLGGESAVALKSPPSAARHPATDNRSVGQAGARRLRSFGSWIWAGLAGAALIAGMRWLRPRAETSAPDSNQRTPSVAPAEVANIKSLAVLPFENLSPDPTNEFFADGMHDEVITSLVKIRDLTVISRASVMPYRKTEGRNLKAIAADLGVANILEGRVRRIGDQVKVTVELIDGRTGKLLWASPYTKALTDVFAIQSELADAITTALKARFSPEEKMLLARRPTENPEAYDLYLRARALTDLEGDIRLREGLDRIVDLYERAVAKDPAFVLAHVQLCYVNGTLYWSGYLDPSPARRARAKAALDAAMQLAPMAPETRLASGLYAYMCENDWTRALAEFRAAALGLPNDPQVIAYIGFALRRMGRMAESVEPVTRAVDLNPRDVSNAGNYLGSLNALRRFDVVGQLAPRYHSLYSTDASIQRNLAYAQLGRDHDRAAYVRNLADAPADANDRFGFSKAYLVALAQQDWAAADRALADPRFGTHLPGGVLNEPVALHRAAMAVLRGDAAAARPFADQAIAAYAAGQWSPRQQPWAMMGTAFAHALAGRVEEATRLGAEGMALQLARDGFDAVKQRPTLARIYILGGRPDDAFEQLRLMMTQPCEVVPEMVRMDPLWQRLANDPRFEQTLSLAGPL